jgi:non-ribosomal peptide synthetase component F
MLTKADPRKKVARTSAEIVELNARWNEIEQRSSGNFDATVAGLRSHHLSHVIYTSDSAGRPKGVMVAHRNVVSLWQGLEHIYARSVPCERIAVNASINFDASVKQRIQLLPGRALLLVPEHVRVDAASLIEFIDEHRVYGVGCTPSQLKSLVAAGLLEGGHHPRTVFGGRRCASKSSLEFVYIFTIVWLVR